MNTRSTRRNTAPAKAKPKPPPAPRTVTTRVTRRQQLVAESQPPEEVVVQTIESDNEIQHQTEEMLQEEYKAVQIVVQDIGTHEEQVVEEEQPQQEVYEEVHHEVVEVTQQQLAEAIADGHLVENHQIIIGEVETTADDGMNQSSDQFSVDLSDCWSREINAMDGRIEFVCKWLLCSFRTQSECSIRKHVVKHQKPFQCSFVGCGQRFKETAELLEHFSATHMDTNAFKCTFADCNERFRDIKSLTAHRVTHVSHTTQLIKANKDYKPPVRTPQPLPQQPVTQTIDLQQIFGHTFDNTTTIELTGATLSGDQQFIVITDGTATESQIAEAAMAAIAGSTGTVSTPTPSDTQYRNKRTNSVIRCPINSLSDEIIEGNDNYVKCRTIDGKFWYKCLWDYCDYGNINEGIIRRHVQKHEFPHKCSFEACSKSFATLQEMADHRQMTHSGPNPYTCDWPECTDAFPELKHLTEHKRNHLMSTSTPGVGGNSRAKKPKQAAPPKPFMCDFGKCNMHYATAEELEAHKQIHSGDRPYKCQFPDCTFAAKSKDKLQIHHSRHSLDKSYRCSWPTCDKSFTIAEQLRRHKKLHTNREQLICEFTGCDLVFETADELERHLRRHIGLDDSAVESMYPTPHKCTFGLCKMHFQTEEELQKHSTSHDRGDRYYKCTFDKCSYSAKTLDKLNAHQRYHSGERPFKCDFIGCHQDFIQSHHLARHRRTHFGSSGEHPIGTEDESIDKSDAEDQIQCGYCELTFDDESELTLHVNNDHSVETTDNDIDDESSQTNKRKRSEDNQSEVDGSQEVDDLEADNSQPPKQCKTSERQRTKSGESSQSSKPIACGFGRCNFRCNTEEEMTEHNDKLHSGDRPFACDFDDCSFKTNRKDKLTVHKRRHTGEKPFKCDWNDCDRSFISKEQLNRHNMTHFKAKITENSIKSDANQSVDKDFDKTLQELEELLQENDGNE